jgi:hypothetical protein
VCEIPHLAGSPAAARDHPIHGFPFRRRDVVVLADDGRWWQGAAAWLTCLWATREYRDWAFRMAAPALLPFVKKAVHLLSENRLTLSRLMKLQTDVALANAILSLPEAQCATTECRL